MAEDDSALPDQQHDRLGDEDRPGQVLLCACAEHRVRWYPVCLSWINCLLVSALHVAVLASLSWMRSADVAINIYAER